MSTVCVIDAGTTSVRCGIVQGGQEVVAHAEVPLTVSTPSPGAAEQDPAMIWTATCRAIEMAVGKARGAPIAAVSISAQRASIALLGSDGPRSPFLLWMDTRGAEALDEIAGRVDPRRFTQVSGIPFGSMPSVTRLVWARSWLREAWTSTVGVLGVADWISSRLIVADAPMDITCAAWTGLLDMSTKRWSTELLAALNIDADLLPPLSWATEPVGEVHPSVADELGLPPRIPIYPGAGDQQCSSVGAGAIDVGTASLNLGTSATFVMPATGCDPVAAGMVRGGHVLPGLEDREGVIPSCGSMINWLSRALGYDGADGYRRLMADAADVPAGAAGIRFVPAFAGLGSPVWRRGDVTLRGLTLEHGRGHIARAALEGLGLQYRHVLESLAPEQRPQTVTLVGGGARSDELAQLLADIGGIPTRRPRGDPQAAALLGAAWIATGDHSETAANDESARFSPDSAVSGIYSALFDDYVADLEAQPQSDQEQTR